MLGNWNLDKNLKKKRHWKWITIHVIKIKKHNLTKKVYILPTHNNEG